jgi:hypothetical protein
MNYEVSVEMNELVTFTVLACAGGTDKSNGDPNEYNQLSSQI